MTRCVAGHVGGHVAIAVDGELAADADNGLAERLEGGLKFGKRVARPHIRMRDRLGILRGLITAA